MIFGILIFVACGVVLFLATVFASRLLPDDVGEDGSKYGAAHFVFSLPPLMLTSLFLGLRVFCYPQPDDPTFVDVLFGVALILIFLELLAAPFQLLRLLPPVFRIWVRFK